MEEGASLLLRLWTEENVTHHGKHYRVDNATIAPRPVQRPRPPIWFGAWAEPAIRRAARLGDAWFVGPIGQSHGAHSPVRACIKSMRRDRTQRRRDRLVSLRVRGEQHARGDHCSRRPLYPGLRKYVFPLAPSGRQAAGGKTHH